jgi:hypothetical protein
MFKINDLHDRYVLMASGWGHHVNAEVGEDHGAAGQLAPDAIGITERRRRALASAASIAGCWVALRVLRPGLPAPRRQRSRIVPAPSSRYVVVGL